MHADGDAALALEVHRVEDLGAEVPLADRPGLEQQLVRQRRLAVVDVRDDAEIADVACLGHLCSVEGRDSSLGPPGDRWTPINGWPINPPQCTSQAGTLQTYPTNRSPLHAIVTAQDRLATDRPAVLACLQS